MKLIFSHRFNYFDVIAYATIVAYAPGWLSMFFLVVLSSFISFIGESYLKTSL